MNELSAGPHTFSLKQGDGVSTISEAVTAVWEVLEIATVTPRVGAMNDDGTFPISGGTNGFGYLCAIGDQTLSPCGDPFVPVGLVDGTYDLKVVIVDGDIQSEAVNEEIVVDGAPEPPAGEVGLIIAGRSSFVRSPAVNLALVWPAGTRQVVISEDGGTEQPFVPNDSTAWTLTGGTGRKILSARFLGPAETVLQTVTASVYLDTSLPVLLSAKAVSGKSKRWRVMVKATDVGSGLSKIEFSTRRSRPAPAGRPTVTGALSRARTVTAATVPEPRWARVVDRVGNRSGWKRIG
ncbi:MAG: hypothetical protein WEB05_02440 [Solirubrobacterales bacterium]